MLTLDRWIYKLAKRWLALFNLGLGLYVLLPLLLLWIGIREIGEILAAMATPIADTIGSKYFEDLLMPGAVAIVLIAGLSIIIGISSGSFCRSPSIVTRIAPRAMSMPAAIAGVWPKLRLNSTTRRVGSEAAIDAARSRVSSLLPSSTNMILCLTARIIFLLNSW